MDKATLLNSNWAITPEALKEIASYDFIKLDDAVRSQISTSENDGERAGSYKEQLASFMRQFEEQLYVSEGGIATLEISGPLMPNPGPAARYFMDAADSIRIAHLIQTATKSPEINQLILLINSPGGMVVGTPEIGAAVREFNAAGKTSYAFADTMMASAAYWIGSQATKLYSTSSAIIGSIGVLRPHVDASGLHDKMGLKVEVFRAGKHKVAGAMGTSLTEEQRQHIQDGVDKCHEEFRSNVTRVRKIAKEHMEGQVFYGADAMENGLIDRVISNCEPIYRAAKAISDENMSMVAVDTDTDSMKNQPSPVENAEDDLKIEDVVAESDELSSRIEELESSAESKDAEIAELKSKVEDLESKQEESSTKIEQLTQDRDEAISEKESLQEDFDQRVSEAAEVRAEELAEEKAAKLAADSGTDPAPVGAGENSDENFAGMSESELWAECSKIENSDEKRAFYVKHIQSRF